MGNISALTYYLLLLITYAQTLRTLLPPPTAQNYVVLEMDITIDSYLTAFLE